MTKAYIHDSYNTVQTLPTVMQPINRWLAPSRPTILPGVPLGKQHHSCHDRPSQWWKGLTVNSYCSNPPAVLYQTDDVKSTLPLPLNTPIHRRQSISF